MRKNNNSRKSVSRAGKLRNKTRKNMHKSSRNVNSEHFEREITTRFLEMIIMIKLYHWKTYSYATHKATDELYGKINDNMDKFVEVLLGKVGNRIDLLKIKHIKLMDFGSFETAKFKHEIVRFKEYLVNLNSNSFMVKMSNSDLYNIRDEILADLNQFLYLFTFNK
jgi:hypothetical protein